MDLSTSSKKSRTKIHGCNWPGCTNASAINAHTISKAYLRRLARANHVLTCRQENAPATNTLQKSKPRTIGINKATVFPGFCNLHDGNFAPIDQEATVDLNFLLLNHYRNMCYQLHWAKVKLQQEVDRLGRLSMENQPPPRYVDPRFRNIFAFREFEVHTNEVSKRTLDDLLSQGTTKDIAGYTLDFSQKPPIAVSMTFSAFCFWDGTSRHIPTLELPETPSVALSLLPKENSGTLVVSWHKNIDHLARPQWEQFQSIESHRKTDALTRLVFFHAGGTCIDPLWWNRELSKSSQKGLLKLMRRNFAAMAGIVDPIGVEKIMQVDGEFDVSRFDWQPLNAGTFVG